MGNNPKLNLVNDDVHIKFGRILSIYILKILSRNEILTSIKGHNSVKILRKMTGNNPKLDIVNDDVHTKFGRILSIRSQDIERKEILTSIKGRNSVKILRKMTGNNPKLDLVNVDVHTKFGQILSIRSQDIERKEILTSTRIVRESDYSPASQLFWRVKKTMKGNYHKLDLINIDAHTKFGLIMSICSQDIERKRNSDLNKGP